MASKKEQQKFNDTIEKYLISIGAKKDADHYSKDYKGFCYQIMTKAGLMDVCCHEADKSSLFSIFIRFNEPTVKVKAVLPNVAHAIGMSGKWNVHEDNAASAMNCLEYRIEKSFRNPIYTPDKAEINYWVSETMDYWNVTAEENRPSKIKQLHENLKMMEGQLKYKTNDSYYEGFPMGECARELKVKYEATKIVIKKIEKKTVTQ